MPEPTDNPTPTTYKKPFWPWVFCETDGTPSFARVGTAVIVAFAMGWVTAIVHYNHVLPDLAGIIMLIPILYGVNKAAKVISNKNGT